MINYNLLELAYQKHYKLLKISYKLIKFVGSKTGLFNQMSL